MDDEQRREFERIWQEVREQRVKIDAGATFIFYAEKELLRQHGVLGEVFARINEAREQVDEKIESVRGRVESNRLEIGNIKATARQYGVLGGAVMTFAMQLLWKLLEAKLGLP